MLCDVDDDDDDDEDDDDDDDVCCIFSMHMILLMTTMLQGGTLCHVDIEWSLSSNSLMSNMYINPSDSFSKFMYHFILHIYIYPIIQIKENYLGCA